MHLDLDWAKGAREEVDEWRHDDDQQNRGETLVEDASVTSIEHSGGSGAAEGPGIQSMMEDLGLSSWV